jgi:ATP-independent RNA helicase DbpA
VINVDITPDPEIHVHRIGRTGRAERDGWAFSLCGPGDKRRLAAIAELGGGVPEVHKLAELPAADEAPLVPPMVTLMMLGGRKDKIRPGDVMGALAGEAGLSREQVGKITVTDHNTYIAVARNVARDTVKKLGTGKVKGKTVKIRAL